MKSNGKDYLITKEKLFSVTEAKQIMKVSEEKALMDRMKGRKTWIKRFMLVHLVLFSGLRVSEARKLQIKNVHLGREPGIEVKQGKRGKDRFVYIDKTLKDHLKQYLADKKRWNHPSNEYEPFFGSFRQGQFKPYSSTNLKLSFKQAIKQAGLRNDLSIHSARHFYASFLFNKTKDLIFVKDQLGHCSTNMTSLYSHSLPEERSQLANQILD